MRKDLDLEITDRIEVAYASDDPLLLETLQEHTEYICGETLCDNLQAGAAKGGKQIKLSGHAINLRVNRR